MPRWLWFSLPALIPVGVFVAWHVLGSPSGGGGHLPRPEVVAATVWRLFESGDMTRQTSAAMTPRGRARACTMAAMRADDLRKLAERFERASRSYAELHQIERDRDWFLLKLQEELGELTQAWIRHTQRSRQRELDPAASAQNLADEAADVLGHVLLLAHRLDLDLASAIRRKWRFDPTAPEGS